jgi:hypothetical protein
MAPDEVQNALKQVKQILEQLNIPLALMGGMALAAWKRIRSTQDVDLLISISGVRTHELLSRLSAAGFRSKGRQPIVRLEAAEFIQLLYEPAGALMPIQVDLLLADNPFLRQALENRKQLLLPNLGFEIPVLRCEDLVILKLSAGRILDRVDAAALLQENRNIIDFGHLETWVKQSGLVRDFHEAWREAFSNERAPF